MRRSIRGKGRLVFLIPEGHRLFDAALASARRIDSELQRAIGAQRWAEFRATLDQVVALTAAYVSDKTD